MKMKSFAMLVASGLLATSFTYVAPAMADDMTNGGQSMQAPADNSAPSQNNDMNNMNNAGSPQADPNNNGAPQSSDMNNPGSSNNDMNNGSSNDMMNNSNTTNGNAAGNNDQGSPDTATGDDDY